MRSRRSRSRRSQAKARYPSRGAAWRTGKPSPASGEIDDGPHRLDDHVARSHPVRGSSIRDPRGRRSASCRFRAVNSLKSKSISLRVGSPRSRIRTKARRPGGVAGILKADEGSFRSATRPAHFRLRSSAQDSSSRPLANDVLVVAEGVEVERARHAGAEARLRPHRPTGLLVDPLNDQPLELGWGPRRRSPPPGRVRGRDTACERPRHPARRCSAGSPGLSLPSLSRGLISFQRLIFAISIGWRLPLGHRGLIVDSCSPERMSNAAGSCRTSLFNVVREGDLDEDLEPQLLLRPASRCWETARGRSRAWRSGSCRRTIPEAARAVGTPESSERARGCGASLEEVPPGQVCHDRPIMSRLACAGQLRASAGQLRAVLSGFKRYGRGGMTHRRERPESRMASGFRPG